MIEHGQLLNYIGGKWTRSRTSEFIDVRNPATAETLVRVPLSTSAEVDEAVQVAHAAFADWRRTPSSAICTLRGATPLSSTRKRR